MNNVVNIESGKLLINDVEIPFDIIDEMFTEEIDNEILKDLRKFKKDIE